MAQLLEVLSNPVTLLAIFAAALMGAFVTYLFMRARVTPLEAINAALLRQMAELKGENAQLSGEARACNTKATELAERGARFEAELDARKQAHAREVEQLTALRSQIETELKALAADALSKNQGAFRDFASRVLDVQRQGAAADLEERKTAVENLVAPLRVALAGYEKNLKEMEQGRKAEYGTLSSELKDVAAGQNQVRQEAAKLSNALRASPTTPGRWGERTLENVLQLAGLVRDVDYRVEDSSEGGDQPLRPDVVVRLPGNRHIVIDSKAPVSAYLDASNAQDDTTRDALLSDHAHQLREHVKQLSDKSYWDRFTDDPDFVVMFVASDAFLAAAVEKDPEIFEEASRSRVLIATPVTLIALAKAVTFGWRQERIAENARNIHELGRELFDCLAVMLSRAADLGLSMKGAVRSYNDFVGSLESRVIVHAQRFADLQVGNPDRPWPNVPHVETMVRAPRNSGSDGSGTDRRAPASDPIPTVPPSSSGGADPTAPTGR
jgi:DNA recombination protein RmuC